MRSTAYRDPLIKIKTDFEIAHTRLERSSSNGFTSDTARMVSGPMNFSSTVFDRLSNSSKALTKA